MLRSGLGLAVAIAISGNFYAFLDAYLYSTLPVDEGERVVARRGLRIQPTQELREH